MVLLLNVNNKNTFIVHFWCYGWHFIQFFRFSAACNKINQNVGPLCNHKHGDDFFIYWQQYQMLCSRLIEISPVASWIHKHSLTSYGKSIAARQSNLAIDWLLKATDQNRRNLSTFFIISMHILLGLISPGSTKADTGWEKKLNGH